MGVGVGYGHWEEEEETGNGKRGSELVFGPPEQWRI